MKKNSNVENILYISILFIIITSIFSLLRKFVLCVVIKGNLIQKISYFLIQNALWLIVTIVIITVLNKSIRKYNKDNLFNMLEDPSISLTTGILITLDGIINLADLLPQYIVSIISSIKSSYGITKIAGDITKRVIIVDIISIFIILCQVLIGVYYIKLYRKKSLNS